MIVTEPYSEGLILTYSDKQMKIQQNGTGIIYDSAVDPVEMHRTYTETDIPIEVESEEEPTEELI